MLKRMAPDEVEPIVLGLEDPAFMGRVDAIMRRVLEGGDEALTSLAVELDGLEPGSPLVLDRAAIEAAVVPTEVRSLLERTAQRIRTFAEAQLEAAADVHVPVPGGEAGHRWMAVDRAGCYAPGGRYPLPSSVLMTAVPARTAGVREVWVASPRASQLTLAAAAVAGADFVLCAGGAQAITALAFGTDSVSPVGVITGPGNRWVTAAKQRVSGRVGIDMLAGPSELLVVADGSADPSAVAADLLAQAEHDVEARVGLLSLEPALLDAVDQELSRQLQTLPTADVASESVSNNGFAAHVPSLDVAVTVSDRLAPEHLHLNLQDASAVAGRFGHYGGIFVGPGSAEVFGDYGLGPNHTLPTCGTGRHRGGLSVFDYMACRTFLRLDEASEALDDARAFAELEGLHAHARSARSRFGRR